MDPVTLGMVVTAIVSHAAGRVGEDGADYSVGVLGKLVARLRQWFVQSGDSTTVAALDAVIETPQSPDLRRALAAAVDRYATADSTFRQEVEHLVDEARSAGVDVQAVSQSVWGNQNVQVANVTGSPITVTYGQQPPAGG
jgi:uncharacterized protein (UPF0335 family)